MLKWSKLTKNNLASEIFHSPLVSETFRKHDNDLKLPDIMSRYSKVFGKYGYSWILDIKFLQKECDFR